MLIICHIKEYSTMGGEYEESAIFTRKGCSLIPGNENKENPMAHLMFYDTHSVNFFQAYISLKIEKRSLIQ